MDINLSKSRLTMVKIAPLGIKGELFLEPLAKLLESAVAYPLTRPLRTPHGGLHVRVLSHGDWKRALNEISKVM